MERKASFRSQRDQAIKQLASQGYTRVNPTPTETALAKLGTRPSSPTLGFGRKTRKHRRGRKTRRSK